MYGCRKNNVLEFHFGRLFTEVLHGFPENSTGIPEVHVVTFKILRSPWDNIYFRNPLGGILVWDFSLGIFRLGIFALGGLQASSVGFRLLLGASGGSRVAPGHTSVLLVALSDPRALPGGSRGLQGGALGALWEGSGGSRGGWEGLFLQLAFVGV